MLLVLISIAWLTVIALCLALCVMARRGDGEFTQSAKRGGSASSKDPIVREELPELSVQDVRLTVH